MEETEVIVVGAGAAGLAAAEHLQAAGVSIKLLEARDRLGGRVNTILSPCGEYSIELGAEFIHGSENEACKRVRRARLRMYEVPDRHWKNGAKGLIRYRHFWDDLESVMERMDEREPDQDFKRFLGKNRHLKPRAKWLATEYIEGFHAAERDKIGVKALARANASSDESGGTRQFKIQSGYLSLLRKIWRQSGTLDLHFQSVARKVDWEPGRVELEAATPWGKWRLRASRLLITVPLAVLQKRGEANIRFHPALKDKEPAIRHLEMGAVVKVTLLFREVFWRKNFGFIHSTDRWLPTWWTDPHAPLLTCWAGGPRARKLARETAGTILQEALRALGAVFKTDRRRAENLLVNSYYHDWMNDPFSQGAYSYTPAGAISAPRQLGSAVQSTIFFAGEATDSEGEQGTVHGALTSGQRAAEQILASLRRRQKE
jgi:monoamine oxidase